MHHNVTAGIILSDQSLVLQSVTKAVSGDYTCQATNTEGKSTSNGVALRVRCKCLDRHSVVGWRRRTKRALVYARCREGGKIRNLSSYICSPCHAISFLSQLSNLCRIPNWHTNRLICNWNCMHMLREHFSRTQSDTDKWICVLPIYLTFYLLPLPLGRRSSVCQWPQWGARCIETRDDNAQVRGGLLPTRHILPLDLQLVGGADWITIPAPFCWCMYVS